MMVISITLFAQKNILIKPENADCENAIQLFDSINGPTTPPIGYGNTMEISGKKVDKYYFEKEHNTVWYTFTVQKTGNLKFDIIPIDKHNDYDFILFKYTDKNFCKDIRDKKIKPIRNNISRVDTTVNGLTGISPKGKSDYVHSGIGDYYSKHLWAHKNDIYYLVVDNVYPNGKGHYIHINLLNSTNKAPLKPIKKDKITKKTEPEKLKKTATFPINLNITDRETSELLNANIRIKQDSNLIKEFTNTSSCYYTLNSKQKYSIEVSSNGYMSSLTELTETDVSQLKVLNISLDKIRKGKNLVIENIYFISNSAEIIKESLPALNNLYKSLADNPSVKIEIQGHINGPGLSVNDFMELSINRAKAVADFLVSKGIEKSRLTYKGMSNKKMLFPHPANAEQSAKNRRVEIVILSD